MKVAYFKFTRKSSENKVLEVQKLRKQICPSNVVNASISSNLKPGPNLFFMVYVIPYDLNTNLFQIWAFQRW